MSKSRCDDIPNEPNLTNYRQSPLAFIKVTETTERTKTLGKNSKGFLVFFLRCD